MVEEQQLFEWSAEVALALNSESSLFQIPYQAIAYLSNYSMLSQNTPMVKYKNYCKPRLNEYDQAVLLLINVVVVNGNILNMITS